MNDKVPVEEPRRRAGLLAWLILSQLLSLVSLLFAFYIVVLYGMGDQGAGYSKSVEILLGIFSCYPIPIILSIGTWTAFKRGRNVQAAVLSGLYLLLLPFVLFVFLTQPR